MTKTITVVKTITNGAFDWAALGAFAGAAATALGALAVIYAAKLGANTFNAWKRQKLTERKIEDAIRILAAT